MAPIELKPVLAIVHQEHSRTGRVGALIEEKGYRIDRCCPSLGEALPDNVKNYAGVVVYGGPMSANDDGTLAGIRAELDWLPRVLEAEVPFLGLCLGAQLMARVLGARVYLDPDGYCEIGYTRIEPVAADHQVFSAPMHVYQWHREGFDVPAGATLLAKGERFPNQAYRYGRCAYGFQFHPEVTLEMKEIWTVKAAERLKLPGAQPREEHLSKHPVYDPPLAAWTTTFLDVWLAGGQIEAAAAF